MNISQNKIVSFSVPKTKRSFRRSKKRFGESVQNVVLPSPVPCSVKPICPIEDKFIESVPTVTRSGVEFRFPRGSCIEDKIKHRDVKPDFKREKVRYNEYLDDLDLPHQPIPVRTRFLPTHHDLEFRQDVSQFDSDSFSLSVPKDIDLSFSPVHIAPLNCCDDLCSDYRDVTVSVSDDDYFRSAAFIFISTAPVGSGQDSFVPVNFVPVDCVGFSDFPITVPTSSVPDSFLDHILERDLFECQSGGDNNDPVSVVSPSLSHHEPLPGTMHCWICDTDHWSTPVGVPQSAYYVLLSQASSLVPHNSNYREVHPSSVHTLFLDHVSNSKFLLGIEVQLPSFTRFFTSLPCYDPQDINSVVYHWAAWRTVGVLLSQEDRKPVFDYVTGFEKFISSLPQCQFEAQGFMDTIFERLTFFFNAITTWVGNAIGPVADFIAHVKRKLLEIIQTGVKSVLDFFVNVCVDYVKEKIAAFKDAVYDTIMYVFSHAAFQSFIKTVVRFWMEYPVSALVLELAWDAALILEGIDVFKGLFEIDWQAQAEKSPMFILSMLLASVMAIVGKKMGAPTTIDADVCCRVFERAGSLATAADRLGLSSLFNTFSDYVLGGEPNKQEFDRWRLLFPGTMDFVDQYVHIATSPVVVPSDISILKYYYGLYLKEACRFAEDRPRIMSYCACAVKFMNEHKYAASATARKEPALFMLAGEPGLGKSLIAKWLATLCAACRIRDFKEPATRIPEDYIYAVQTMDKYLSGYIQQDIFCFDDWCQAIDSVNDPSQDIALLFTLITAYPMNLNMAAVEDKGRKGNCNLVIGATNVEFFQNGSFTPDVLNAVVRSVHKPEAVRRRLTYIVKPIVNKPYVHNVAAGCITLNGVKIDLSNRVDPEVLYRFIIFGTDNNRVVGNNPDGSFSWRGLCKFAYSHYKACLTYSSPEAAVYDDDISYMLAQANEILPDDLDLGYFTSRESACDYVGAVPYVKPEGWSTPLTVDFLPPECVPSSENSSPPKKCDCDLPAAYLGKACWCKGMFTHHAEVCVRQNAPALAACGTSGWVEAYGSLKLSCNAVAVARMTDELYEGCDSSCLWKLRPAEKVVFTPETWRRWSSKLNAKEPLFFSVTAPVTFGRLKLLPDDLYYAAPVFMKQWYTFAYSPLQDPYAIFGALLLGITFTVAVHYATRVIVSGIYNKVAAAADFAYTKVTETLPGFVYDDDEGCFTFTAQANPIVTVNGVKFVLIRSAAGHYKLYEAATYKPQAIPLSEVLVPPRFKDQIHPISNNIYAVVDGAENLLGNVLVVDETHFVTPVHVAQLIMRCGAYLRSADHIVKLTKNTFGETSMEYEVIGDDLASVYLYTDVVPKVRFVCGKTLHSKFVNNDHPDLPAGAAIFLHRSSSGALSSTECAFWTPRAAPSYVYAGQTFSVAPDSARLADRLGFKGDCGGVYLYPSGLERCILGLHVAGKKNSESSVSAMTLFTRPVVDRIKSSSIGTGFPVENGPSSPTGLCSVLGVPSAISAFNPVHPPVGSVAYSIFPDLSDEKYALARMSAVNGVDPLVRNVQKIANARVAQADCPDMSIPLFVVSAKLKSANFSPPPVILDYPAIVGSECDLSAIDKTASSGKPFDLIGSTKAIAFDSDGTLKRDFLMFLYQCEDKLCPPDWNTRSFEDFEVLDAACVASLKDEPRPVEKVELAATRVFTVSPIHEFFLDRKYFIDLSRLFTKRNLAVCSALGLSQEDFGAIHEHLSHSNILAADFSGFDQSFTPRFMKLVARVILSFYPNTDPITRVVDPDLPPLDRDNFMRYRLLKRLFNFKAFVGGEVAQFGIMHPSGSFLTTIINIIGQMLIWVDAFLVAGVPLCSFWEEVKMVFLGDDSLIATRSKLDLDAVIARIKVQGFVVTSDVKDHPLSYYERWDPMSGTISEYKFLSRHFASSVDQSCIYGVLCSDRLLKSLAFTDYKNAVLNLPSQVVSFLFELRYWQRHSPGCIVVTKGKEILSPIFGDRFVDDCFSMEDFANYAMKIVNKKIILNPEITFAHKCKFEFEAQALSFSDIVMDYSFEAQSGASEDTVLADCNGHEEFDAVSGHGTSLPFEGIDTQDHAPGDIFGRPFRVGTFNWLNSNAQSYEVARINGPSSFFNNNISARTKLYGFAALRCTFCVQFRITPSPYACGKLLACVRPVGPMPSSVIEATSDMSEELSPSAGSCLTMKVNFLSPNGWLFTTAYDADSPGLLNFDFCIISLMVLNPLNQVVATSVPVAVYCWLEDVALRIPSAVGGLVAQAPPPKKSEKKKPNTYEKIVAAAASRPASLTPAPGDEAILSDPLSKMVKKFGAYVRTYGGTVVDTLVFGSKIALAIGLSMPSHAANTNFMTQRDAAYQANLVAETTCIKLASIATQKIVLPQGVFGVDADELDINYFCSRRGLIGQFTMTTSNVANTILYKFQVSPFIPYFINSTDAYFNPLALVASMFQLWRGDTYLFVSTDKNAFQSGEIEISWNGGIADDDPSGENDFALLKRVIWNLKLSNAVQLTCPQNEPLTWNVTRLVVPQFLNCSSASPAGVIYFRVLSPLIVADGTAPTSINFNIYTSSTNIQFARPGCYSGVTPVPRDVAPPDSLSRHGRNLAEIQKREMKEQEGEWEAQSGPYDDSVDESPSPESTSTPSKMTNLGKMMCIGEDIGNLRLLLHHMRRPRFENKGIDTYSGHEAIWFLDFRAMKWNTFFNAILPSFAFWTGGMRARFHYTVFDNAPEPVSFNVIWRSVHLEGFQNGPTASPIQLYGTPSYSTYDNSEVFNVDVPYMCPTPFLYTPRLSEDTHQIYAGPTRLVISAYLSVPVSSLVCQADFYTQVTAADDFSFGWQIAPGKFTFASGSTNLRPYFNYQLAYGTPE